MESDVSEWIEKAEGDFTVAQREYRKRKDPSFDAACFHAQQCVEKYLKGYQQTQQTQNLTERSQLILAATSSNDLYGNVLRGKLAGF